MDELGVALDIKVLLHIGHDTQVDRRSMQVTTQVVLKDEWRHGAQGPLGQLRHSFQDGVGIAILGPCNR